MEGEEKTDNLKTEITNGRIQMEMGTISPFKKQYVILMRC